MERLSTEPKRTIEGLTVAGINKVNEFLPEIGEMPFFQPRIRPKSNWRVFCGETLSEARRNALDAAKKYTRKIVMLRGHEDGIGWTDARNATIVSGNYNGNSEALRRAGDMAWDAAMLATGERLGPMSGHFIHIDAMDDEALFPQIDAASDMMVMARINALEDLPFEGRERHTSYMAERIEAWKGGYGVAACVDGILFLYCVGKGNGQIKIRNE